MSHALFNKEDGLHILPHSSEGIIDHVPGATYVPRLAGDPTSPHPFYQRVEGVIAPPEKLLGRSARLVERFKKDYKASDGKPMGIMLTGEKGCGKTALAEKLGEWFLQQDLPVLNVDKRVPTALITDFCQLCPNGCLVLIDEFEKTYSLGDDRDGQDELLSLFTDSRLKNTVFVLTANNYDGVSGYIKNRPQRMKYHVSFEGLEERTALELLEQKDVTGMAHALMVCKAAESNEYSSFDEYKTFCEAVDGCSDLNEVYERVEYLNIRKDIQPMFKGSVNSAKTRKNILELGLEDDTFIVETVSTLAPEEFNVTGEFTVPISLIVGKGETFEYETKCFWSGEEKLTFKAGPVEGEFACVLHKVNDWGCTVPKVTVDGCSHDASVSDDTKSSFGKTTPKDGFDATGISSPEAKAVKSLKGLLEEYRLDDMSAHSSARGYSLTGPK